MKVRIWACVAQMEGPGKWNIVGIFIPGLGQTPLVNSKREVVEAGFGLVSPETKAKGAKIICLEEIEVQ